MKRIILSAILLSIAYGALAQEGQKSAKDRLTEIENMADQIKESKSSSSDEVISVDALSHLYVGGHMVSEEKFPGGKSHEVGLNIIQFKLEPAKWLSFEIGCDLKWDRFIAKGIMYEIDANNQFALSTATPPSRLKSKICAFGFSAPADIALHFGKFGLRFGAEATYDLDRCNKVKNKFRDSNGKRDKAILNGGQIQNFRQAYFAGIEFDDLGAYFKYCPGTIIPGSINLENLVSVGVYVTM
ncbi:MAG: hypothetical protein IKZ60_08185 [Bacteroidales bacterium]|nr:hypothetical protein [Bacteroidales bacterium]